MVPVRLEAAGIRDAARAVAGQRQVGTDGSLRIDLRIELGEETLLKGELVVEVVDLRPEPGGELGLEVDGVVPWPG